MRISTVTWNTIFSGRVLGYGWASCDGKHVRTMLADYKADGSMIQEAEVIRLPRRFHLSWNGHVYDSRECVKRIC